MEFLTDIINIEWIRNNLQHNQFLIAGIAGASLFLLKETPRKIFNFLNNSMTSKLLVTNEDMHYNYVLEFIAPKRIEFMNRTFSKNRLSFELNTGYGKSWFLFDKTLCYITRQFKSDNHSDDLKEEIEIIFFTRSKKKIEKFLKESEDYYKNKSGNYILTCENRYWDQSGQLKAKSLNKVYINHADKENLIKRIDFFINNEEWYLSKGIPYKLGIFISGNPGTGKTSISKALALYLKRDLYIVNKQIGSLSVVVSDGKGILVFEDIDSLNIETTKRDEEDADFTNIGKVSLSTLLNTLDGALTPHGLIFIATTNHPDKLDPAITRKGRFDIFIEINELEYDIFTEMVSDLWEIDINKVKNDFTKELYINKLIGSIVQDIFITEQDYSKAKLILLEKVIKND